MNKSQQIRIDVNNPDSDRFLKIKLEQNVDVLELLTLKIKTKDVYRSFNSDYGVLVGRVIANNGIGIPNAKVSIFIPLTEEDEDDDEISSIYPYKTPRDKNVDGKRYNLLPRVGERDPVTGQYKPKQPFGSFPTKPEIVTNKTFLNIYKKYYKFSTVTNSFGDYMIFGAPIGLYTVHMSVDLTDIGKYSMTPSTMVVELGYSPNLFTNNNTRIKPNNDLDDLPHIETQEISVDIKPFWGNKETFQIGITRQDFRIRAELVNTFVVFGSALTDGEESAWGTDDTNEIKFLYRIHPSDGELGRRNLGIGSKRTGIINEKIFYYPKRVTDEDISSDNLTSQTNHYDGSDHLILDKSEYTSYKNDGAFVFEITCNRNKVIINDLGNEETVDDTYSGGIYREFRGFITFDYEDISLNNFGLEIKRTLARNISLYQKRARIKVPQQADQNGGIGIGTSGRPIAYENNANWRKQHKLFVGGNIYSVAQFHGTVINNANNNIDNWIFNPDTRFLIEDGINNLQTKHNGDPFWNVGVIHTNDEDDEGVNSVHQFPKNAIQHNSWRYLFGANWLNFSLYLMQISHVNPTSNHLLNTHQKSNTCFTCEPIKTTISENDKNINWFEENNIKIAAGISDMSRYLRNDLHWTDFILVDKLDLNEFLKFRNNRGFIINKEKTKIMNHNGTEIGDVELSEKSYFRNGDVVFSNNEYNIFNDKESCPIIQNFDTTTRGGRINGNPNNSADTNIYFYKGKGSDCLNFLKELGYI